MKIQPVLVAAAVFSAGASLVALLSIAGAAPGRAIVEIWGVEPGDEVAIDGAPVTVKGGARAFSGDPTATSAPVVQEIAAGRHEIVVRMPGCASRTFAVDLSRGKRVVILERGERTRCAIPLAPPARADAAR